MAVVPDVQMDKLKFMLGQSDYNVEFRAGIFKNEDNVRVVRGALCGLTGTVQDCGDGLRRITVCLPLLGGATVRIDSKELEKIQ